MYTCMSVGMFFGFVMYVGHFCVQSMHTHEFVNATCVICTYYACAEQDVLCCSVLQCVAVCCSVLQMLHVLYAHIMHVRNKIVLCLRVCVRMCLYVSLCVWLCQCVPICVSIYASICVSKSVSTCVSSCVSVCVS